MKPNLADRTCELLKWLCNYRNLHNTTTKQLLVIFPLASDQTIAEMLSNGVRRVASTETSYFDKCLRDIHIRRAQHPSPLHTAVHRHAAVCRPETRFTNRCPCGLTERCRISTPHFLAECRQKCLNQASFVFLCFASFAFSGLFLVSVLSVILVYFLSCIFQRQWHCIAYCADVPLRIYSLTCSNKPACFKWFLRGTVER